MYTVRGEKPSEEQVDKMIESGESETIFQQAILEQGRGRVCLQETCRGWQWML